jgi:glycosyltransferase involved in cell wall biosynthesis
LEQKRILIAIPVLLLGGTEIHTLSLVRILVEAGYRVMVCCYYEFDNSVVAQFKEAGADVILLRLDRSDSRFGINKIKELIHSLVTLFREYRPDIVHVQYLAPGLIPIIAARIARVPTVFATVHIAGSIAYGLKAKLLLRTAAKLTTAFICVSQGVERFWFGNSHLFQPGKPVNDRKHFTIYNAVDVEKIERIIGNFERQQLKHNLGITGRPVIGFVGRLTKQKGVTLLLDAIPEIRKNFPNVVTVIAGDGPEKDTLNRKAVNLGISNNVLWLGAMPREEVLKLYRIMDVFVMPSLYEGFGLTAAEAMAAGIPVIGTNVDGLNEVVNDHETGFLIPVSDVDTLISQVLLLLKDSNLALKMGELGRERIRTLFPIDKYCSSILFFYKMLSK